MKQSNQNRLSLRERIAQITPYYHRLLGSFLAVGFVLFFFFSLLMMRAAGKNYREELHSLAQNTLEQAETTNRELLMNVFAFGLQSMEYDNELIRLMYSSEYTTQDAVNAKDYILELQKYNDFLEPIYIINYSSRTVLTSDRGRCPFLSFPNQELLEMIESSAVSSAPIRYIPQMLYVKQGDRYELRPVWSLIFHSSPNGALVLNVDYTAYSGLMVSNDAGSGIQNYILNSRQQVLSGPEGTFGQDLSESALLRELRAQPENRGSFLWTQENGSKVEVVFRQNSSFGMTYFSIVEYHPFGSENRLFLTVAGCSLLFLAASLVLSVLLSAVVYRPIRELREATGEMTLTPVVTPRDEFKRMNHIFATIRQKNALLERDARAHKMLQQQKMLHKLLDPDAVSKKYSAEQYDFLYSYFSDLYYCCVLVCLECDPAREDRPEEMELLKYSTTNMMEELCQERYQMSWAEVGVDRIAYVCNFNVWKQEEMETILTTLCNVLQNRFHARPFFAVSTPVEDIDDLPQCYQQVRALVERRFLLEHPGYLFCSDPKVQTRAETAYPAETENALMQAMRGGDAPEAKRCLERFFQQLRVCPLENVLMYLIQLDLAYQKLERANQMEPDKLELNLLYRPPVRLSSVMELFLPRTEDICSTVTTVRESNSEKLVQQIHQIVVEQLCDPNLSVASIADEVHLSVNYLRNVYKEATGESLSGYITRYKLEKICWLLTNSDLSIQEISEKLGFTTRNYFFTFFKKHTGMTPKQYRLMQGNLLD
ncbi:MAG: helix-turn-helix domain-containing protein [Faecalibacterium sp.]